MRPIGPGHAEVSVDLPGPSSKRLASVYCAELHDRGAPAAIDLSPVRQSAAGDSHRPHRPGLVHRTLCVSFVRALHNSVEGWERGLAVKACPSIIGTLAFAGAVAFGCPINAAEPDSEQAGQSKFRDPDDGKLDLSAFLASAYGFVPLLVPITDPAVGYGAVAAAVFVHGEPPAEGEPFVRPTISAVGGLRTENGTRGWFGANLGTWRGGRVRTIAALADMDVNLEFFGLGGDAATATQGLPYSVKARGGVAGGNYRLGDTQLWMGLRYTAVDTRVSLEPSVSELPNVPVGRLRPSPWGANAVTDARSTRQLLYADSWLVRRSLGTNVSRVLG